MNWRRALVVAAALAAIAAAVVLGRAPGVVEPYVDLEPFERAISNEAGMAIVAACAVVIAALGLKKGRSPPSDDVQPLAEPVRTGGSGSKAERRPIDESLRSALDAMHPSERERHRDEIRKRLASVATRRIATVDGCPRDAARDRVNAGAWTDDPVVASFLGDETGPEAPFRWRLYEWLYEDRALEAALERTIAELEAYDRGVDA